MKALLVKTNEDAYTSGQSPLFLIRSWPCTAVAGLVFLSLVILASALAHLLTPYDPNDQVLTERLQMPSLAHLLGTDNLGRDVMSRLLYGGRFSLTITTVSVLISGVFGALIGAIAGRSGRLLDELPMRVVDVMMVFPEFIVALAIASLLKPSFGTIVFAITIFAWTPYARLARAVTLDVNTRDFVEAAVALGSPGHFILRKHIIPNIIGPILAMGFLRFGQILITIAGLSFLGVGAQPPTADWGAMLSEAQPYMRRVPTLVLAPGITIFITALSVTLIGQAAMLKLDPKRRRSG